MNKLNLKRKEKQKTNLFGMSLTPEQELFIKRRLEELREKCPSTANLNLKLEQRKSCIIGTLKVNSFSENFFSSKVASEPVQVFILLQEDIEAQLLDWKRNRFSNSLFSKISPNLGRDVNCA